MAHFAELDENNIVKNILIVKDSEIIDSEGNISEELGVTYLNNLYGGGFWKQYDSVNPAKIKGSYNSMSNVFIEKQPHLSWVLNKKTYIWEAPVAYPDDGFQYTWNEATTNWAEVPKPFDSWVRSAEKTYIWEAPVAYPDDDKFYTWDEVTTNWIEVTGE